ncbi:unnamed protein product [Phytophthora lilii]|uniref:Unnamed protein product n=1 Tax=Phytophthora lilii TaxID=2077276 RepID=A0A9W6TEC3_9STRA|nr:unnamed protein product [Phytophthora lilii]
MAPLVAMVWPQLAQKGLGTDVLGLLQEEELTRVGHLLSKEAPPIAGGAAFATQQPHSLCLNLEGARPIRTIYSADAAQLDEAFLTRFEGLTTAAEGAQDAREQPTSSADQWAPIRGAGLAPLLHTQCDEKKLPFIAWVMPCSEGNNVPDAAALATQLFGALRIAPKQVSADPATTHSSIPPMLPFAFPPSWNQLFGRGPDVSLYL